jgi:hypothetical protein
MISARMECGLEGFFHRIGNVREKMVPKKTEASPQTLPVPVGKQHVVPVECEGNRSIATLKKADGFSERVSLKQQICTGTLRIIHIDRLSCLSPGEVPEDYLFWFNLCAAHGVKVATADRVFDLSDLRDWSEALDELGFALEEKQDLVRGNGRKTSGQAHGEGRSLLDHPPPPYVNETSLGGVTVDFDQLETMEKVWSLAERYSMREVAEKVGLPVSIVRRALSMERLLFYQGLWLDPETGDLRKGQWPALMNAEQAGQILANRQRNCVN